MSKIATGGDCNTLLNYTYFTDEKKCPTYSDTKKAYGLAVVGGAIYADNQLVQLADLDKVLPIECTTSVRNSTSSYINPRIDIQDGSTFLVSLSASSVNPGGYASQIQKFNVKPGKKYTWYLSISTTEKASFSTSGIGITPYEYTYYEGATGTIEFYGGTTYIDINIQNK